MLSRHQKGWLDLGYLSRGVKRKRVLLVGKSEVLQLIKLALNGGEAPTSVSELSVDAIVSR
ncbi:hypothetical protein ACWX0K_08585 [Nitrobacteraceae bacterium UC4446_H13]